MSKRKPKPVQQKFNPINYLKTGNARKLPVFECLVPEDWEEIKKFPVICARRHVNGNITFTSVLIDLMCTGAKDVIFFVNEPEFFYRDILSRYEHELMLKFEKVSYELVHNIIFESIAFAEDFGIAPHEDFRWSEYILEVDSDDFPRIEIPLGQAGKAILYLNDVDDRKNYFERQIKAYGQPGSYQIIYNDLDWDDEFDEDDNPLDFDDFLENSCFNWDKAKWGEFYDAGKFEYLTRDILIHLFNSILDRNYEELKGDMLFAPFMQIEYSLEADYQIPLNEDEMDLVFDFRDRLNELQLDDLKEVEKLLKKLDVKIKKNPSLVHLYMFKWQVFIETGDLQMALNLALLMKEKFPASIFSLSCHALTLAEMDDTDEVPDAMNNFTRIQDFDQRKAPFHLEEISAFYSPWIWYYAKTNQIRAAYFLNCLLIETQAQIYFPQPLIVFDEYIDGINRELKPFLEKLRSGKIIKRKFLEKVVW